MKKVYTKPEIFFESFTASTALAGNCEVPVNLPTQFVCPIPDDSGAGINLFDPKLGGGCNFPGNDMDQYDGLCYHIHDENHNLFNS